MYGLLLETREIRCPKCDRGIFTDSRGSQHVCRNCNGKGKISLKEQIHQIIGKLRPALTRLPITSTEYSLTLRFTTAEDCLLSLRALHYHRIRARVLLENNPLNTKGITKPSPMFLYEVANNL